MQKDTATRPEHTLFTLRYNAGGDAMFVLLCTVIGTVTGAAAALLKYLIAVVSHVTVAGLEPTALPWRFLAFPVAGIVISGCLQRYVFRRDFDHGSERINEALARRRCLLPWSVVYGTMTGATVTLGLGGSAGAESPIAYVGAAIGSRSGRLLGMTPAQMAAMVAIGAGAGIAGIFRAPVGGMMFAFEVLTYNFSTIAVVGLACACIAAGLASYVIGGFRPDLIFSNIPDFDSSLLLWSLPLGIFCGLYSAYYSGVMTRITARLEAMERPLAKWLVAGGALALMVFTFPALYGEGYNTIARILDGSGADALMFGSWISFIPGLSATGMLILLTGCIALFKAAAAAVTNSGGGVAGDFAPTIFAGAVAGFFFATIAGEVAASDVPASALVFMAMGGVMAGSVRAPLMAMFLMAEMTGAFGLFMPLALTCVISYLVMRLAGLRRQKSRAMR